MIQLIQLNSKQRASVVAEDLLPDLRGNALLLDDLLRMRPGARGMRVVGTKHHLVYVENAAHHLHADRVVVDQPDRTWFGIITRQSIRRGTFTSVTVLIKQIRDYIEHWNTDPKPFEWIATADEILARVQLVQTSIKQLVDNNAK